MQDYKEMYIVLFQSMTKAITILQEAQKCTENMYISPHDDNISDIIQFETSIENE